MNKIFSIVLFVLVFSFSGSLGFAQNGEKADDVNAKKANSLDKLLTFEEQKIFENADKIEVLEIGERITELSLDAPENQTFNEKEKFHGFKTVKAVSISDVKQKKLLITNLFSSVGNGSSNRCFNPRHGIRATYKNKTVELLICFECGWIYSFIGNELKYESISEVSKNVIDNFLNQTKK